MNTILGLDLGTTSVGWSLIEMDETEGGDSKTRFIAGGVRHFDEPVNPKDGSPLNTNRRAARLARRTCRRRRERKAALKNELISLGFLPKDQSEQNSLFSITVKKDADGKIIRTDAYFLRAKALDEKLERFELGKALFQLLGKRGYRKTKGSGEESIDENKEKENEKETGVVKQSISAIGRAIKEGMKNDAGEYIITPSRTLGEMLSKRLAIGKRIIGGEGNDLGGNFHRDMTKAEFNEIFDAQAKHYPELTPEVRKKLGGIAFFQLPVTWDRNTIADCKFIPHRKCAPKSSVLFQRFRILETLSNLHVNGKELDWSIREQIYRKALTVKNIKVTELKKFGITSASFEKIKDDDNRKVGSNIISRVYDCFFPQLPKSKSKAKKGEIVEESVPTEAKIAFEKEWNETFGGISSGNEAHFSNLERLINEIIVASSEDVSLRRVKALFPQFPEELSVRISKLPLDQSDRCAYSSQFFRKVVPLMEQGMRKEAAIKKLGLKELPSYKIDKTTGEILPPDLRNPTVKRVINESKKVINAVKDKLLGGKYPDKFRIEMARDLKNSKDDIKEMDKVNKENEEKRNDAKTLLEENGFPFSETNVLKVLLWKELSGDAFTKEDVYEGKQISLSTLMSDEIDVEHIVPYSRSLDDSFANKTLAFARFNRDEKKNDTPLAYFNRKGEDAKNAFLARLARLNDGEKVRHISNTKKNNFLCENPENGSFASRQLNDTRYACKELAKWLAETVGTTYSSQERESFNVDEFWGSRIQMTTGRLTSSIRKSFGWNAWLNEEKEEIKAKNDAVPTIGVETERESVPGEVKVENGTDLEQVSTEASLIPGGIAVSETKKKDEDEKNRNDLRHHFIDATIIALTSAKLVKKAKALSESGKFYGKSALKAWNEAKDLITNTEFESSVKKAFDEMLISHKLDHSISGPLHEETRYGKIHIKGEDVFVKRTSVSSIEKKNVDAIIDDTVRSLVSNRLAEFGGNPKVAFEKPLFHKDGKTPIRTVRVKSFSQKSILEVKPDVFFDNAGNHHAEILMNKDGDYQMAVVSNIEAKKRVSGQGSAFNFTGNWKSFNKNENLSGDEWKFQFGVFQGDSIIFGGKQFIIIGIGYQGLKICDIKNFNKNKFILINQNKIDMCIFQKIDILGRKANG